MCYFCFQKMSHRLKSALYWGMWPSIAEWRGGVRNTFHSLASGIAFLCAPARGFPWDFPQASCMYRLCATCLINNSQRRSHDRAHTNTYTHSRTHACTHARTHAHAHTHAHTHTHTHICAPDVTWGHPLRNTFIDLQSPKYSFSIAHICS